MNFKLLKLSTIIIALLFAIVPVQGQTIHQVSAGDNTLNDAIQLASNGDIIELVDDGGVYRYTLDNDRIYIDSVFTIRAAEGLTNRPIIRSWRTPTSTDTRNFEVRSGGSLTLIGLEFDGSGDGSGTPYSKQAVRLRAGDSTSQFLKVDDCYFHDYTENFLRGYLDTVIDTLIIQNTISTNALREGWNLYDTGGDGPAINYALFENVTITKTGREAIQFGSNAVGYNPEVIINHCTMDSTALDQNDRVIRFSGGNIDVTNATITNCIMSNQMGTQTRCVTLYGTSTISYTDTFNVRPVDLDDMSSIGLGMLNVDPMYTDPANFDYTLQSGSPVLGQANDGWAMGDLRWDPGYIPVTIHRIYAGENTLYDAIQAAASGDIIELVDNGGVYSYTLDTDRIYIDKVLTIRAAQGLTQKPIIRNWKPSSSTDTRNFEVQSGGSLNLIGLEFDGSGDGSGIPYSKQAVRLRVGDSSNVFLKVDDCYFHDYTENFLRGYTDTVIDTFIVQNTISTNALREGWNLYDTSGDGPAINYCLFENVTITKTGREAIQFGSNAVGYNPEVIINHCTMDSTALDQNDRVIRFSGGNIDVTNATIKNCIMSNQMGTQTRAVTLYGTSTIAYSDTFNTRRIELQDAASIGAGMIGADPMYADPANFDYRLATASLCRLAGDDGRAMGDLRWEADPGYFYLNIYTVGSGTVALNPTGGLYAPGTPVTLTANPSPGWAFDQWDNASIFPPNVNPAVLTMNQDETVTAHFLNLTPQVTLTIDTLGFGGITVTPEPNDGTYDIGTIVTLTAVPDPNWHFVEWLGDFTSTMNPVDVQLDSNMTITGSFLSDFTQFTLTDSVVGLGSIAVNPEPILGTYDTSTVVYVTAEPALGWEFTAWGGDLSGSLNPDSVTMNSDKLIIATFSEMTFPTRTLEIDSTWDLYDAVEFANNNSNIDSLLLTTIGVYTSINTSDVAVMAPLTIAAAPGLSEKPIITNSDSEASNDDMLRVFDDLTVDGVIFDGGHPLTHGPKYGIRLRHYTSDSVKTGTNITITNCDFRDFFEDKNPNSDGHPFKIDTWIKAGDILFENCTFTNTGYEAIKAAETEKWPTDGALESLTVRNCTFTNIDAEGIRYYSDLDSATADAPVLIEHVTFNNSATRTIYLKNSGGAIVRDIIISNSRLSNHGRDGDLMDAQGNENVVSYISDIDTFNVLAVPIKGTDALVDQSTIWGIDPQFEDQANLNYTLLPASHLYGMGHDGEALGDLNWATNTPTHKYLTITVVDSGNVDLSPMPVGYTYDDGTVVTLTAVPDSLWEFVEWGGDLTGNTNPDTITMNADKSVTATFQLITGIDGLTAIPTKYELSQNYPNPFNPSTTIKFALKQAGHTTLKIYDVLGRVVATLVDKEMKAGYYSIVYHNPNMATGLYFYKIQSDEFSSIKKMMLVK